MKNLEEELKKLNNSGAYAFHMPGHKRNVSLLDDIYGIDITEIEGYDNLHQAEGIIAEAQKRAATMYGAEESYFLVNGSSCGVITSILAATNRGDRILLARNSHKSAYNAVYLNGLKADYIYPEITDFGIQGHIDPEKVKDAFEKKSYAALVITSPTYEGIISDIKAISEICHENGAVLIVDAAHGAHLGFGGGFPESPVKQGADLVVMSLHKTLPSLTQTAILHRNSDRVSGEKLKFYLGIMESSSPSYVFMAAMDKCLELVRDKGQKLFREYRKNLDTFYEESKDLKNLHVMRREDLSKDKAFDWDDSKLVIECSGRGAWLEKSLREDYNLWTEMTSYSYCLGMTSISDTKEGFDRLNLALHEIDKALESHIEDLGEDNGESKEKSGESQRSGKTLRKAFIEEAYRPMEKDLELEEALNCSKVSVKLKDCEGKTAGEYLFLYPPGIPMIVPGEIISKENLEIAEKCLKEGLNIQGPKELCNGRFYIIL